MDLNFNRSVVDKALQMYKRIHAEDRTPALINAMLRTCLHFKHPDKGLVVWNDVERIVLAASADCEGNISYPALLKCCIKCNNVKKGQRLHTLIGAEHTDIFTQTTLIYFYGHFGDAENAQAIFNALEDDARTSVTIGAMMKVLVEHGQNDGALLVYDAYAALADDVVHLLALKACTNANNRERGESIARHVHCDAQKGVERDIELLSTLIDFYGHFGDVDSAHKIFAAIAAQKRKVATVNCMMKVFVNNERHAEALAIFDS